KGRFHVRGVQLPPPLPRLTLIIMRVNEFHERAAPPVCAFARVLRYNLASMRESVPYFGVGPPPFNDAFRKKKTARISMNREDGNEQVIRNPYSKATHANTVKVNATVLHIRRIRVLVAPHDIRI